MIYLISIFCFIVGVIGVWGYILREMDCNQLKLDNDKLIDENKILKSRLREYVNKTK